MRDTEQQKICVLVFGDKEKKFPMRATKRGGKVKTEKEIITQVAKGERFRQTGRGHPQDRKLQREQEKANEDQGDKNGRRAHTDENWKIVKS